MDAQHDEQYFLEELVRLFDPDRIYRQFGGFGEEAFVEELQQYYERIDPEDKRAFEQAVRLWLWSGDELRQMQAIRLCGDLRLKGCVGDLLRLGETLRRESPDHEDLNWVVQALGQIGDTRALDFLTKEAIEGEYRNGALVSISEIDRARALQLMPTVVEDRYQTDRNPVLTEWLFSAFLDVHQGRIAWQLGVALRHFPDKEYLLEQFRKAVRAAGYDASGKWLGKRDKRRLLEEFRQGLEQQSAK